MLNAAAAVAAALSAGATVADAELGLAAVTASPWRMDVTRARSGALIVNDSYNANPESMSAALRSLAELNVSRRVAILGAMAELGDVTESAHAEVAALAEELQVEVVAIGTSRYGVEPVAVSEVVAGLGRLDDSVGVLVKGSRVAGLEGVAAALLEA